MTAHELSRPSAAVALPRVRHRVHPDPAVARARRLAQVLDHYLLDPVLGLIVPAGGDVAGALLGLYTVAIALRRRVSPVVVARMLLNLGLDALIGVVPLLGDLFDVGFRANLRNVDLLEDRLAHGGRARPRDWFVLFAAAVAFAAMLALVVILVAALARALRAAL